jgi:hypothetical protein
LVVIFATAAILAKMRKDVLVILPGYFKRTQPDKLWICSDFETNARGVDGGG